MNMDLNCPFCNKLSIIAENKKWFSTYDKYPVSNGHILIISKRHYENYFDSNQSELSSFNDILFKVKQYLTEKYKPDGFNIGFNIGEVGGQTVFHAHIHVIPIYCKDVANPKGGVRGMFGLINIP